MRNSRRLLCSLALVACAAAAQAQRVTEFPIPTTDIGVNGMTVGPDGAIWFTTFFFPTDQVSGASVIDRIGSGGGVTEIPIQSVPNSCESPPEPVGLAAGPDGNIWFTDAGGFCDSNNQYFYQVGRLTLHGVVTRFTLPRPDVFPLDITRGPDGNPWFVEISDVGPSVSNGIGRVTTDGTITEFLVSGQATVIIGGPDGNLWFADSKTNAVARMTTSGAVTEFSLPTANAGINSLAVGPDGAIWFTERLANQVGRITLDGATINEYPVAEGSAPHGITAGPDNALWFAEYGRSAIGRLTRAGSFLEFATPTRGSAPLIVRLGSDGAIWFGETRAANVGVINLPILPSITFGSPAVVNPLNAAWSAAVGQSIPVSDTGDSGKPAVADSWDFGDGSASVVSTTDQTVNHTYTTVGTYTVTLTVGESTATASITIVNSPRVAGWPSIHPAPSPIVHPVVGR